MNTLKNVNFHWRLPVFVLLLCMFVAGCSVSISHAANKHESPMEKNNRLANSSKQAKKDISASDISKSKNMLPKLTDAKKQGNAKPSSVEPFDIYISGEYKQADAYEMLDYVNSTRGDSNQLQWDSDLELLAMMRAAELSIYYDPKTCPDGSESYANFIAVDYTSADSLYYDLYESDFDYIEETSFTHFAASAFTANNGTTYWAIVFFDEPIGSEPALNENFEEETVEIRVDDVYLDWESELLTSDGKTQNGKKLQKGKKYNAWIYVYNYDDERGDLDYPVLLQTQDSKSSNNQVISIDEWGTMKANNAGYAKISLSPSVDSEYEQTAICVVTPEKVTGLKLSSRNQTITASWKKITGVSGYEIYRSTKSTSGYKRIKTISGGSTVKYANGGLKKGQKYYYKVRSFVNYNGTKYFGAFSQPGSAKVKK